MTEPTRELADERSNPNCFGRGCDSEGRARNVPNCECLRIFEELVSRTSHKSLGTSVLQLRKAARGNEPQADGVFHGLESLPDSAGTSATD
jgi:hypothetical protein